MMHALRKFKSTLAICGRILMARTFGKYAHSGWNGQNDYALYRWRDRDYFIQITPAKPENPEPLGSPTMRITDHSFTGGASDAYCATCGRAYFVHAIPATE